jgi:hypothetical protein
MDSRTRPPRQKWLTTAELVTDSPHHHLDARYPEAGSGNRPCMGSDGPAVSLMERVLGFLDHYGSSEGSAPPLKGHR